MSDDLRQSLENTVKKFGFDLGLPKVDVDKLIETHKKNFDALVEASKVASSGAQQVVAKQRELLESTFNDALALIKQAKPGVDAAALVARQREAVSHAVDKTIASTGAIAEHIQTLNNDILKIVTERIAASADEFKASFQPAVGQHPAREPPFKKA
jgi:phasin family protein